MCLLHPQIPAPQVTENTFLVFHRQERFLPMTNEPFTHALVGWPDRYHLVAIVEADESYAAKALADKLANVWGKTNHGRKPWQENEGVIALQSPATSTGPGDVVLSLEDHSWWVVTTIGYQSFELPEGAQHELCH